MRFLAITLGGWTMIRVAMLMPEAKEMAERIPAAIRVGLLPQAAVATPGGPRAAMPMPPHHAPAGSPVYVGRFEHVVRIGVASPQMPVSSRRSAVVMPPSPATLPPALAPTPVVANPGRWSGSAWALVRGGASGTVSGGQLGASQAGVRMLYALSESRRLAVSGRLAAPLRGRGREAAIGLDWRPTDLPVRLIAEQRFVLDGGRGGPTVGVIGGYGPTDIAPGVRIETYGQAGAIARDGVEGFVDAAGRLSHSIVQTDRVRADIGVGAWGSAQRAVARFDIGPSIGVAMPVAGRSLRLNLDWRERMAGRARPGSGPALSVGSDF